MLGEQVRKNLYVHMSVCKFDTIALYVSGDPLPGIQLQMLGSVRSPPMMYIFLVLIVTMHWIVHVLVAVNNTCIRSLSVNNTCLCLCIGSLPVQLCFLSVPMCVL